jgi:peptidoglycan/LPS O-acetylase OafA/YrhL
MKRLLPIEGLRAYLAIWVIIGHVMFFSTPNLHALLHSGQEAAVGTFLRQGALAVDIFMIISGFVIFLLLDKQRETFSQFILRRFFRLYPIYIVLLIGAIATESFHRWTFEHSQIYMAPYAIDYYTRLFETAQAYGGWNIFWHIPMLHGVVPNNWLGGVSSFAFIVSAWSVSVEWQFYLLAPLTYALVKRGAISRLFVLAAAFMLFFYFRHGNHFVAFLPLYTPYFFMGMVSYFLYKAVHSSPPDTAFPIALGLAVFIFFVANKSLSLLPVVLWLPFFGLLCEPPGSLSSRIFLVFFNHRIIQYLGAISYSLYLSHELVITVMQYVLITFAPEHGKFSNFCMLLALTLAGTLLFSAALHHFIEVPGIEIGRKLAARLKSPVPSAASPASDG